MHACICYFFSNFQNFKAGMVAACFATGIMVPGDRIKCLLQVSRSLCDCMIDFYIV